LSVRSYKTTVVWERALRWGSPGWNILMSLGSPGIAAED
jgi:hypothetical protein